LLIRKVTHAHYGQLFEYLPPGSEVVDVGVGTGLMLDRYAGVIRRKRIRVHGIDIDRSFLRACRRRIERHGLGDLVTARYRDVQDFLEHAPKLPSYVYFAASFMLMPERNQILDLLRQRMEPDGRVLYGQTLFARRSRFAEWLKPRLKYLTTIDFGRPLYRSAFMDDLCLNGFDLAEEAEVLKLSKDASVFFQVFQPRVGEGVPVLQGG
jgi:alpha-N-acetylglucosaminidase